MARIALLAPTGMLGSAVYDVLKDKHELVLIHRDADKLKLLDKAYGDVAKHTSVPFDLMELKEDYGEGFPTATIGPRMQKLLDAVGNVDAVVNAAGIIKPYSTKDPIITFFINGALPHILSTYYQEKLIQITTDCAFDGIEGAPYTEESVKRPTDLYGLSKAIGEPSDHSLVLRTSIIGPEIHSDVSLIAWVRKQHGQSAKGFTRHLWNGITTRQFGKIVDTIVSNRSAYPDHGLFHVFSNDVTKYDMVTAIAKKYNVDVKIEPDDGPVLDRRLGTVKSLNAALKIPSFEQMLEDIRPHDSSA